MMGKTKTVIGRPLNKVYHLELVQENEEIRKEDDKRKGEGEGGRERPRRQVAIISDLKQKFVNEQQT